MKSLYTFVSSKALLYGTFFIIVVSVGWFVVSSSGRVKGEFMVAKRGEFVQSVSVSGKVIAAQDVDLGFSQSGRVVGVYAKVGNTVGAGAVLAEVENGDLRANVLQREATLGREESKLLALKQGTRPEEVALAESAVESDSNALGQANHALLEELQDAYRSADDAVHNQIDRFIANPRSANPQINFLVADIQVENDVEAARLAMEPLLTVWKNEVDALSDSSNLLAAADRAQKNFTTVSALLASANAALNRAIATPSVTQTTINGYITDVANARTSVNTAASALTSAVTAQKDAAAALDTSKKNLVLKKAGAVQADIDAQAAQVNAAEADLLNARAQLAKTIIRAPFSGIVTKMDLKVGAIVSANASEVSLASAGTFQIESFVPEVNIALIQLSDEANVSLDAYGSETLFSARVVSIDPAETLRDGVSTYRVLLQFSGRDERIRSGMTANVRITTEKKENVLSVPQGIVFDRNGKKYVRVKAENSVVDREVTTGTVSSLGNVEILTGLEEGDTVVLSGSQ